MKKAIGILLIILGLFWLAGGIISLFRTTHFDVATPYQAGRLVGTLIVPLWGLGVLLIGLQLTRKPGPERL